MSSNCDRGISLIKDKKSWKSYHAMMRSFYIYGILIIYTLHTKQLVDASLGPWILQP